MHTSKRYVHQEITNRNVDIRAGIKASKHFTWRQNASHLVFNQENHNPGTKHCTIYILDHYTLKMCQTRASGQVTVSH